ncbi:MAG TPA: IS4 family transposase [Victivallales bacterium]|nr:IS4 family transposase [Victivallales bacterium]HRU01727.1 IS4 family transposase [Victivallales bacterium]
MPRRKMNLLGGIRLSDYLSVGVMSGIIPMELVKETLKECGCESERIRKLPAELMIYYVILLALYSKFSLREVLRCLLEGFRRLNLNISKMVSAKSAISKARSRLGAEVFKRLFDKVARPIAVKETVGAWFKGLRLVGIDGSTLEIPDEEENLKEFGRPGASRGQSAFPQIRFVALFELGTRVVFSAAMGKYCDSEKVLAEKVLPSIESGMLCIADRYYMNFDFCRKILGRGAHFLFRAKKNSVFKCLKQFEDGSYLSEVYPDLKNKRRMKNGIKVRVIEYMLKNDSSGEKHILVTSILSPMEAPADELAALYHERWELEIAYDEIKTHIKEPGNNLRSKNPKLVEQEFYGYMLAHYVVRNIIHKAALKSGNDPDEISFVHAVRVIKRRIVSQDFFSLA